MAKQIAEIENEHYKEESDYTVALDRIKFDDGTESYEVYLEEYDESITFDNYDEAKRYFDTY